MRLCCANWLWVASEWVALLLFLLLLSQSLTLLVVAAGCSLLLSVVSGKLLNPSPFLFLLLLALQLFFSANTSFAVSMGTQTVHSVAVARCSLLLLLLVACCLPTSFWLFHKTFVSPHSPRAPRHVSIVAEVASSLLFGFAWTVSSTVTCFQ